MSLPLKLPWELAQNRWSSQLNPLMANALNKVTVLHSVSLITGENVINHMLGQKQQGWFITDINAGITIYRSAPLNNVTLALTCSGPAIADIGVF